MNFLQKLEKCVGKRLKVKVNNNRSTMLRVCWESDYIKVSMHQLFLMAPQSILKALAPYLRGDNRKIDPKVEIFIKQGIKNFDYSSSLDPDQLTVQGKEYNLQEIYDSLNVRYFRGKLDLKITWFGRHKRRRRSLTLGLYDEALKLIKIHCFLDSHKVPRYVIEFVTYHEMVHSICSSYIDRKGRHCVHTEEFKVRERRYRNYEQAQCWIKSYHGGT